MKRPPLTANNKNCTANNAHPAPPVALDLQLSPRSSSIWKGAALAYQVAIGDVGAVEPPPTPRGSEALIEAGMVGVLMRVASRSATQHPPSVFGPAERETGEMYLFSH